MREIDESTNPARFLENIHARSHYLLKGDKISHAESIRELMGLVDNWVKNDFGMSMEGVTNSMNAVDDDSAYDGFYHVDQVDVQMQADFERKQPSAWSGLSDGRSRCATFTKLDISPFSPAHAIDAFHENTRSGTYTSDSEMECTLSVLRFRRLVVADTLLKQFRKDVNRQSDCVTTFGVPWSLFEKLMYRHSDRFHRFFFYIILEFIKH